MRWTRGAQGRRKWTACGLDCRALEMALRIVRLLRLFQARRASELPASERATSARHFRFFSSQLVYDMRRCSASAAHLMTTA